MRDEIYCGGLISEEGLEHSAKGSVWKNHKYVKKEDGRYYYPDDMKGKPKPKVQSDASEEELQAAENEYREAEAAYEANPTEENRARLTEASDNYDRAKSVRRNRGEQVGVTGKEGAKQIFKKKANEHLNGLFNRPSSNTAQMLSTRANYPVGAKNPTTSQLKKGASVVGKFVKSRVEYLQKEHERAEKIDQWYKDGKPVITDENADMYLTRSAMPATNGNEQSYKGSHLTYGAGRSDYSKLNNNSNRSKAARHIGISRPKNIIGRTASKDGMDQFLEDHPSLRKGSNGRPVASIDASPYKKKRRHK